MKNLALGLTLVCFSAAGDSARAAAPKPKPDPSQYTVTLHVSAVRYATFLISGSVTPDPTREILAVTTGDRHYQLENSREGFHAKGLIDPGDYRARLTKDEHQTSYESQEQFEILFPNGSTGKFDVIGQSE